jgi:hypothetical protein
VDDVGLGMVEKIWFLERPFSREGETIIDMF